MFKKLFDLTSHFHQYSEETIIKKIKKYNYVSFDVFDTLIKRNCAEPRDIFVLVAQRYNASKGAEVIDPAAFCSDRIRAARTAREAAKQDGRSEITHEEIYRVLSADYSDGETLKELEIQEEINSCFANIPIKRVFEDCLKKGKKVCLISDMYLSEDTIRAMVEKCGYAGYTDLLVSSKVGCRKRDGALYAHYLKKHGLSPSQCVHIGDSYVSDHLCARRQKIHSVCIATYPKRSAFCRKKGVSKQDADAYRRLKIRLNNGLDPKWSDHRKFGYECIGPMLYYFATWLHQELAGTGIDKLFFLSRDGYLIRRVYEEIYGGGSSQYLYISRRSVHVPLFHKIGDIEKYLMMNGANKRWSLTTACNRLAISVDEALPYWKEAGLAENASFRAEDIKNSEKLQQFFDAVTEKAVAESVKEYDACVRYLADKGFSGKVAVVDTGGNRTTQKCLEMLRGYGAFDADLKGYYLWSYHEPDESFMVYPCTEYGLVGGETVVCELPMTSDEGTTVKYRREPDGTVVPVIDEYEFKDDPDILRIIDEIQHGALDFAAMMKSAKKEVVAPSVAYHNAMMATRHPRLFEANLFGDLYFHSDNEDTYLAKPRSIFYYAVKPKSFISEFKLIRWKVGYLKRLLKLPLPYYGILKKMKGQS